MRGAVSEMAVIVYIGGGGRHAIVKRRETCCRFGVTSSYSLSVAGDTTQILKYPPHIKHHISKFRGLPDMMSASEGG